MNPLRPFLRQANLATSIRRSLPSSSSGIARLGQRTLVTPSAPLSASVHNVNVEQRVREDPGEVDEGDIISGESESGKG